MPFDSVGCWIATLSLLLTSGLVAFDLKIMREQIKVMKEFITELERNM